MSVPASSAGELLVGAMLTTTAADGNVTEVERQAMNALRLSVPELRDVPDVNTLIPGAAAAMKSAASYPEWLRKKAFVLGVEAVTRGNTASFKLGDESLAAIMRLRRVLGLEQGWAAAVLFTARCKYVDGAIDAESLQTMVDAIVFVAGADGEISDDEMTTLGLLLATVPQFGGLDPARLLEQGWARRAEGTEALRQRLAVLPKFRDKTYAMASEVAFAGGFDPAAAEALRFLELSLALTPKLPQNAWSTWPAKFATGPGATVTTTGSTAPSAAPSAAPGEIPVAIEARRDEGDFAVFACVAGDARFELWLKQTRAMPGLPMILGEGAIGLASPEAARTFLDVVRQRAGKAAPSPLAPTKNGARASVVILSTSALKQANGFAAAGGTWTTTKWTFEAPENAVEVYINLDPLSGRGEIVPREDSGEALVQILEQLLA